MTKPSHVALLVVSIAVAVGAGAAIAPSAHKAGGEKHWSYEGETGPEHWSGLDPAFDACKLGHRQSPIDIPAATIKAGHLDPLRLEYKATPLRVVDNGHTVMVTYAPGSFLRIGAAEYELQQLHFHRPSEEEVDGKTFPMVGHLVHRSKDGKLAVVAVLFDEGSANPTFASVLAHLPAQQGKEDAPAGVTLDAAGFLPASKSYFTFEGSLTTPPCSEGVTWYVLRTPSTLSAEQIAQFAKRYPHNARPVQPLDGREIRASE